MQIFQTEFVQKQPAQTIEQFFKLYVQFLKCPTINRANIQKYNISRSLPLLLFTKECSHEKEIREEESLSHTYIQQVTKKARKCSGLFKCLKRYANIISSKLLPAQEWRRTQEELHKSWY